MNQLNKIKIVSLLLYLLLLLQAASAQKPDLTDYLRQRFSRYCREVPREEIYIHTDRDVFIAGEDLWFNIFLTDRQSFRPSQNSKIVYFEILNAANSPVVRKRILIGNGAGAGHILLPDTLSPGTYSLRAYTNWMKNFLPYDCFIKNISIYNALSDKLFKLKVNDSVNKERRAGPQRFQENSVDVTADNSRTDSLELFIRSDKNFRYLNDNHIYIFIQTHGNINHLSREKISGDICRIPIPETSITYGINQITIFDSGGKPVAERFIYTPAAAIGDFSLDAPDSCGLRKLIKLKIVRKDSTSDIPGVMSVSVAPSEAYSFSQNIDDYLLFGTEFGSDADNMEASPVIAGLKKDQIDSVLLHIRSNWIDWRTILSTDLPHFKYPMESDENLLPGKVLNDNQQPVQTGELVLMCVPGKTPEFQYAVTDNDGNFTFKIQIDKRPHNLIFMPDDISKKRTIMLESPFSDSFPEVSNSAGSLISDIPSFVSKMSINHQVQEIYGNKAAGTVTDEALQGIPLRFYGRPDFELVLSDYIGLPVMNEIFYELLPGVSLKNKKSGYEISIAYHEGDELIVMSPTLMIDGVIIKDAALIANLDPETVAKIDVIKEKYFVGKYIFPGILNVITKAGDFSNIALPDYMIRQEYRVAEPVESFVSPAYTSPEMMASHIPDYRNTLYWNPSVRISDKGKAEVEFWSSDNKMSYVINIQGITSEGKLFSIHKTLKIN